MIAPEYMIEQARVKKQVERGVARDIPAIFLPYAQRILNPFPLASSGNGHGDFAQPWTCRVLALYVTVLVNTTNNGTNYWTIAFTDGTGGAMGSVNTSLISANSWQRLQVSSITQPPTTNAEISVAITATLSPGSIYVIPSVAVVKS